MTILDPKTGLNRRKLVCPRCSKSSGYVHLGLRDCAGICNTCKTFNIGLQANQARCEVCKSEDIKMTQVPADMSLPKICKDCLAAMAAEAEIVQKGGIFWTCIACNNTGMIEAGHPLAVFVRRQAGVEAPDPCVAQLDKTSCPVCREDHRLENLV